jgi:polyhydroxyalkanoate synthesis regulator protein
MIVAFQGRYDTSTTVYVDLSAVVTMTFDEEDFEVDLSSMTSRDNEYITEVNIILEHENETVEEAKARILKAWALSRRRA